MAKRGKGSAYERSICRSFSHWWSNGKHDDLFWRSATSGGRATQRAKTKRRTVGHYGDLCATCPDSSVFIDVAICEIKCGYGTKTNSIGDVLDPHSKGAPSHWEEWYWQTRMSWEQSGAFAWLLIQKRDGREPLIFMPHFFYESLVEAGAFCAATDPLFNFSGFLRRRIKIGKNKFRDEVVKDTITGTTLKEWFNHVSPEHIKALAKYV